MNVTLQNRDPGSPLVARVDAETIEASNVNLFRAAMEPLVTSAQTVVLDLSAVKFMDSSALGALLSCLRKLSGAGGTLRLANLASPVKMLFSVVKMDRAFDIYESVEAASA